jgi:hypothetical protein
MRSGNEECKAGAFADNFNAICVQKVFKQYERLTSKSEVKLNADKTEILALNTGKSLTYHNSFIKNI